MKQQRSYPAFTVTRKAQRALAAGHLWVYADEVIKDQPCENGALVDVFSEKGRYLGTGLFSEHSKIRVRVISRNANDCFDEAFWHRRILYAWQYRKAVMKPQDLLCCRIIFGEADGFPGLTVDRFGRLLSVQVLSAGMERLKPMLFALLVQVLVQDGQRIEGLYERNDGAIRLMEGLEQTKGWYSPDALGLGCPGEPFAEICENDIRYTVDVAQGQKTGFFLDQKYNRALVARIAKGRRVLDCFTHTGSFALNAAKGGAASVTAVDISEAALQQAQWNAQQNGMAKVMRFVRADVFDLLAQIQPAEYDFIILDPPAFTKSRKTVSRAMRGYYEINYRAMKLLPRGGYLATCSCSHFADDAEFVKMLQKAAFDAQVHLRQIEARQQAADHPVLWGVPETAYLKFYVFQVV